MSRGVYRRPLDRDRHFVIGYAADELVSYARERTVAPVARKIIPTYDAASQFVQGYRAVRMGADEIGDRSSADADARAEASAALSVLGAMKAALFAGICIGGFFTMRAALSALREASDP